VDRRCNHEPGGSSHAPQSTYSSHRAKAGTPTTLGPPLLQLRADGSTASTVLAPADPATTAPATGDQATAQSGLATVRITTIGLTIEVSSITASATARCVAWQFQSAPPHSPSRSWSVP
jgi:hypothetical protein